mmetsp:Transcript_66125/g.187590  ORF Transcript_66125/g.187590 Transcript_66125/m.187590 type:complete len:306 (+) Transcript_66125:798-1715(+)
MPRRVGHEKGLSALEMIIPRRVRVHVVLQDVLSVPGCARKADGVQGEKGPHAVLRLVHPVVAERPQQRGHEAEEQRSKEGTGHVHEHPREHERGEVRPEGKATGPRGAAAGVARAAEVVRQPPPQHRVEGAVVEQRGGTPVDARGLRRARRWPEDHGGSGRLVLRDDLPGPRVVVVVRLEDVRAVLEAVPGVEDDLGAARVVLQEGLEVVPLPPDAPQPLRRRIEAHARRPPRRRDVLGVPADVRIRSGDGLRAGRLLRRALVRGAQAEALLFEVRVRRGDPGSHRASRCEPRAPEAARQSRGWP